MATTTLDKKANDPGKIVRPHMVSFRVTAEQFKKLCTLFEQEPAAGIRSSPQYARKILVDFLSERLVYKNKDDKIKDLDVFSG